MRGLAVIVMLAGMVSEHAGDLFTDGMDAYRSGRFADAYALLYPVPRSGNAEAKYLVGRMLDDGLAGRVDPDGALRMFIGAAH